MMLTCYGIYNGDWGTGTDGDEFVKLADVQALFTMADVDILAAMLPQNADAYHEIGPSAEDVEAAWRAMMALYGLLRKRTTP